MQAYQRLLASGRFLPDPHQRDAVQALDDLWQRLAETHSRHWCRRLWPARKAAPRGLYLWGGVGRGKTWLMDLFYASLPFAERERIHFHRFMARVHEALQAQGSARDPLTDIARQWARRCRVLCFDEFFVADIADAMLLSGLLAALTQNGVVLVATSNLPPDGLYADGLQRARFLPAIELLKRHTRVLHVGGDTDFRLRLLEQSPVYRFPLTDAAEASLAERFEHLAAGVELPTGIRINGRILAARQRGDGIAWFSFDELCRQARSTSDYIELARRFNTVVLSDVPVMGREHDDAARRFINLVDEFYDRNVKLLITAEAAPDALYLGRRLRFEFERTASRLIEMQSHDYLARPHLP